MLAQGGAAISGEGKPEHRRARRCASGKTRSGGAAASGEAQREMAALLSENAQRKNGGGALRDELTGKPKP
jgi:hypothetical protein